MTVQELIEKLRTFPPEMPVVVNDADTAGYGADEPGFLLNIEEVAVIKGAVALYGSYSNEYGK